MITIKKVDFDKLVKAGLINFGKYNRNFTIINKFKKSKRRKYAVVESKEILRILNSKD